MGLQPHAAVGDGGAHGGQLDGGEHVVRLADGRLGGYAVGPVHTVVFPVLLGVGHGARGFANLHAGGGAQAEVLGIGRKPGNAQV